MPNDDATQDERLRIPGIPDSVVLVEVPFPNFYVNTITIAANTLDFAFTMSERLDQQNQMIKARAVMTPVHAKLFSRLLADQVRNWEAKNGEITLPGSSVEKGATGPSTDS
jgi:hypothetical protein